MLYSAELIRRSLINRAFGEADRAAGSNDLVSKSEQKALSSDVNAAANAVREAKGPGARITIDEIVEAYAHSLGDDFARVNTRGAHWLSAAETEAIGHATTREKIWDVRARMRAGLSESTSPKLNGLFRRQLVDSFAFSGEPGVKVAFFDADSTLRVADSGTVSANSADDVELLPFVGQRIKDMVDEGYLIAIISNQGGVGAGFINIETADRALEYTADLVRQAGGAVHWVDFAEQRDEFRKPNIGMAQLLETHLKAQFGDEVFIDKAQSIMVGDSAYKAHETRPDGRPGFSWSNSDRLFAENYGIEFIEPQHFFEWDELGVDEFENISSLQAFWLELG